MRPLGRQEYDLDLVCEVQLDWRRVGNPVVLLDAVETRLRQHDTYRTMLERKNRCIRVKYASEFHLDILPVCPDPPSGSDCVVIPDRDALSWKPSNPRGYAAWFESRARLFRTELIERAQPLPGQEPAETKSPLKLVVQLMKRWRDIAYAKNPGAAPISIVLTTLAGRQYTGQQSVNEALADGLNGIVARLPSAGQRLVVLNPANPNEDLSESWNDSAESYEAFVAGVVAFQNAWRDINQQRGIHLIARKLEGLFGEDLTMAAIKEQAEFVEKARSEQRLGIRKNSGVISIATTASVPIRRNTFHGS